MMTFICYLNFTEQGAKGIKDITKRYEAGEALVKKLGGRVVCASVTTGQYDALYVVEMPNGEAVAKFSAILGARGFVRTTTVRAFAPGEFGKIVADIAV
jgi:uncharacterized protein with GYD domain